MARQAGVTSHAPQPVGPCSQSARIGRLKLAGPDIEARTRPSLRKRRGGACRLRRVLDDVLRVGVFLVHRSDFAGMDAVYRTVFNDPPPA